MRIAADADGVTVVNAVRRFRTPWSEIADFRVGRVAWSTCLDVVRRDGSRVHAWVVTSDSRSGYSDLRLGEIQDDLRARLARATGRRPATDTSAVEAAVAAARSGDARPAAKLLARHDVADADTFQGRVVGALGEYDAEHGTELPRWLRGAVSGVFTDTDAQQAAAKIERRLARARAVTPWLVRLTFVLLSVPLLILVLFVIGKA
jgi:hypothetical protein